MAFCTLLTNGNCENWKMTTFEDIIHLLFTLWSECELPELTRQSVGQVPTLENKHRSEYLKSNYDKKGLLKMDQLKTYFPFSKSFPFSLFTLMSFFYQRKMNFYMAFNSSQFENTTKNSFVRNRFKLHMPFTYHERLRDTFIVKCSESGATMKPSWF